MALLRPPSDFMLPLADPLREAASQTCNPHLSHIPQLIEDYLSTGTLEPPDHAVEDCVYQAIVKLCTSHTEQAEKAHKLTQALHNTVPVTLANEKVVKGLQQGRVLLEGELVEVQETVDLLERRLKCQDEVMAIQERSLGGKHPDLVSAWRHRVLQMLVQKEMDKMGDDRRCLALESRLQQLENVRNQKENEIEILRNKNIDLISNVRLKDKHIHQLTTELANLKQVQLKTANLAESVDKTCQELCDLMTVTEHRISDKLSQYEAQTSHLTDQLLSLQELYNSKEEFYQDKLEALLIEHTQTAPSASSATQTHEDVVLKLSKLTNLQTELSSLTSARALLSTKLLEAEQGKSDYKEQLVSLKTHLTDQTLRHGEELALSQKRESKAAIRAKHLERQVGRVTEEMAVLSGKLTRDWEESVKELKGVVKELEFENRELKQAIRSQ